MMTVSASKGLLAGESGLDSEGHCAGLAGRRDSTANLLSLEACVGDLGADEHSGRKGAALQRQEGCEDRLEC